MPDFNRFLPYLVTPLLGAFIGYLTNAIALRMMFRPLRPWRLLGLRLPLTPGIIPSKRRQLAARLGRVVGDHLVTSEDALQLLERENIHDEIRRTLQEKIGLLLDRELGPLFSLVPNEHRARFRELIPKAGRFAGRAVAAHFASADFEQSLRRHLGSLLDGFLAQNLETVLAPERRRHLENAAAGRLRVLLGSPRLQAAIGRFIDERIDDLIHSDRPLREFLPADLADLAFQQLEKEIPPLMDKVSGLLYDPAFRSRLEKICRDGIRGLVISQKGLARILALFVNLEKAYERIPEFIDKTGAEVARLLREEQPRLAAAAILRERLDGFLARPPAAYLEKMPLARITATRRFLRNRVLQLVGDEKTAAQVMALATQGIERIRDRSFYSLGRTAFGEESVETLRQALADELLLRLRAPDTQELLERVATDNLERAVFRKSLGKLSSQMPADLREELEETIFRQLLELLRKETPRLFTTLNVSRMVEEKINSLDILAMENLLLGIMRDQFKYINLFGALLGFLIGLANVALMQWRP
ncbi:MAG: DUF445 family protein [Deltaproteobacteria bacterium]|nr:DUF445 family protein [Deltaproteobacteria bacterium]